MRFPYSSCDFTVEFAHKKYIFRPRAHISKKSTIYRRAEKKATKKEPHKTTLLNMRIGETKKSAQNNCLAYCCSFEFYPMPNLHHEQEEILHPLSTVS